MLPLLQMFKVNRKTTGDKPQKIQLHEFCNASEKAYGCCIYLRTINDYNEISVQLICAKYRVAPLKNIIKIGIMCDSIINTIICEHS